MCKFAAEQTVATMLRNQSPFFLSNKHTTAGRGGRWSIPDGAFFVSVGGCGDAHTSLIAGTTPVVQMKSYVLAVQKESGCAIKRYERALL
jgi:hypothetical protein